MMPNVAPDFIKVAAIKAEFEGYRDTAYRDTGKVWTIGTGLTYNYDKGRPVREGDFITRDTNARWLAKDNESVISLVNHYIKVPLNPSQSAAIVDYVFNRGIKNFLDTNLDEYINANPLDQRIKAEIVGTGLKDRIGNILWGLGRRRKAEAYLYVTGILKFEWPKWGKIDF